jgi:hypothetical protein
MSKSLCVFCLLVVAALALDPPVWPDQFFEAFDERFVMTNFTAEVNGIMYYDAAHNRSRLDRFNGEYDKFCQSLSTLRTPCQNLVVDGKRWIVFPQKSQCCYCCGSEKGCGILKPDWLAGAEYLGEETIEGVKFNKWNKGTDNAYNYYWATADENAYPRRINENGTHIIDYNFHSYRNTTLDDKLFAVPSYCKSNCSDKSVCGMFRLQAQEQ